MSTSETSNQPSQKRQCWECFRRRLVCDFSLPACKKCQKAGRACPGYDEKKPLQWLEPGKITSRRRKKGLIPSKETSKSKADKQKTIKAPGNISVFELSALAQAVDDANVAGLDQAVDDANVGGLDLGDDVEDIPREECSSVTSGSSQFTLSFEQELLDFPRFELTSETYDVVQAVHYYNTKVYPDLLTIMQMAPNPYIIFFPLAALHFLPVSILHTLACFALCHRIHQLPKDTERLAITEKWSRVYYHRGVAIRELSEKIGQDNTRCSDSTISSVCLFLCMELQQSASPNWQSHADGLLRLINLRGGLIQLFQSSAYMRPVLITFLLVAILGNTTSPSNTQITLIDSPGILSGFIKSIYETIFPHVLCPPNLFLDIISINTLRSQVARLSLSPSAAESEAEELLARIDSFSPEDWAQPNASFHSEWLHIGTVYQSAIAIYCIASLQSISILPFSPRLAAIKASHGDRLSLSLKTAVTSRHLQKFVLWPLVVAGVEAKDLGLLEKCWVEEMLEDISRDIGSSSPLKARRVLREFWESPKSRWDCCFHTPYAFVA